MSAALIVDNIMIYNSCRRGKRTAKQYHDGRGVSVDLGDDLLVQVVADLPGLLLVLVSRRHPALELKLRVRAGVP